MHELCFYKQRTETDKVLWSKIMILCCCSNSVLGMMMDDDDDDDEI